MNYRFIIILLSFFCLSANGQTEQDSLQKVESEYLGIFADVYIDTFFVTAKFEVDDFIKRVVEDSSFYDAFRSLRTHSHDFDYDIEFYNKKKKVIAGRYASNRQTVDSLNCRQMEILQDSVVGKYFKKGKYRYYTSSLFKNVFLTQGKVCQSKSKPTGKIKNPSALQYHISMLKRVIFMPGIDSDLPLVGRKMAIFSDDMKDLYDYSITRETYKGIDCYVFGVSLKEKYKKKNRKAIVRELITYFDKKSWDIVSRSYVLRFKNLMYKFDIAIDVDLQPLGDKYIPTSVKYDGVWDLAFRKAERAKFNVKLYNFK